MAETNLQIVQRVLITMMSDPAVPNEQKLEAAALLLESKNVQPHRRKRKQTTAVGVLGSR